MLKRLLILLCLGAFIGVVTIGGCGEKKNGEEPKKDNGGEDGGDNGDE